MPTEALFAQPRVKRILQSLDRSQSANIHAAYQQFLVPNQMLIHKIKSLKGERLLLTNGSHSHAIASTHALGVLPYFSGVVSSNSGVGLKPDSGPYILIEKMIRYKHAPRVPSHLPANLPPIVFFDDRLENHFRPKHRGWTTVWIQPNRSLNTNIPSYVDYVFPNVHAALGFFLILQAQYN